MTHLGAAVGQETDVCGIFFDSSSDIYKDVNSSIISLESFKSKYNIDASVLPRLYQFVIRPFVSNYSDNPLVKVLQFLDHAKLMTILNVYHQLKVLSVDLDYRGNTIGIFGTNGHSLVDIFNAIIDNFIQIEQIDIKYMYVGNNINRQEVKQA